VSDPAFADDVVALSHALVASDWSSERLVEMFGPIASRSERYGLDEITLQPRDRRFAQIALEYVEDDRAGHITAWLHDRGLEVADLQARLGEGSTSQLGPAGCGTAQLKAARDGDELGLFGVTTIVVPRLHIDVPFHCSHADPRRFVERVCWRPLKR
jgi:hypothetical protein